jgi:hypothetical protein
MIVILRAIFGVVLVTMLCVTGWASRMVPLWDTPRSVATHPWFIATLFDAYFAFLAFCCWVAYKETSNFARAVWLFAILALGNIAIAVYMLVQLFRVPANAPLDQLLLRRK